MSEIKNQYDFWAEIYDSQENSTRDTDQKSTNELSALFSDKIVVECGCGTGKNTLLISRFASKVYGMDFSGKMLEMAKKKVSGDNIEWIEQDLTEKWKLESECSHLVTFNLVLEHIQNLEFIFSEANRVLKSKGIMIISEYHPQRVKNEKKATIKTQNDEIEIDNFFHSIEDYEECASKFGMKIISQKDIYKNSYADTPTLIQLLIQKEL